MNKRIFLCLLPFVLAACQSLADRAAVALEFPIYQNEGKPDLTIDLKRLAETTEIIDRSFTVDDCALQEGAVGSSGYRRILLFDTAILNAGGGDLVVGDRADPNNLYAKLFEYAPCHRHYHIRDFSVYELLRPDDRSLVVAAHKQGFCFRDNLQYEGGASGAYVCSNQGITSGWADLYGKELDGQWIDITGVPEGDYILRVTINAFGSFDEGEDRYPNVAEVPVHVPAPDAAVRSPLADLPWKN